MLALFEKGRYTFGMEKRKQSIPNMIKNWGSLSVAQKRGVLTVLLFGLAVLLIVIALIIGISSCAAKKPAAVEAESVAPIPALLRAPNGDDSFYDPSYLESEDPNGESEWYESEDPNAEPDALTDDPEDVEPTGSDDPVSSESQYTSLKKKDKGESVTALQTRLMDLGYLEIEEPTDYFGSSTEYAVTLFQRQHGLKQDGIAGEQTQTLLYSKDAQHYMMLEGAEGRDVKMLQEQLVELGYLTENDVDRIYGEKTVEAVKAFQKRNGLTQDGKAGEKTLEKLYSDEAKVSKSMEAQIKAEEKAAKATPKTTPKPSSKTTAKASSKTSAKATAKPTPTPKKDTKIDKFIKAANSKIGCEYVLGDKGPKTFDCSGFVYYCLKQAGVSTTRLNAAGFSRVSRWKNISKIGDIQKGDILFFKSDTSSTVSHCGIYIGSGMMIDASSANGKVVKRSVSAYWKRNFVNARRPWA